MADNMVYRLIWNKIKARYKITLNNILIVLILLLLVPPFAFGYKTDVHNQITSHAVDKSFIDTYLTEIGFKGGVKYEINTFDNLKIKEWIQYGSEWEDDITFKPPWRFSLLSKRGSLYCHFYDPLFDMGYYEVLEEEKGEPLIHRMNDYVESGGETGWLNHNEWSYQMARDLFYAALTGDSTQYDYWYMMDRPMIHYTYSQDRFEGKEKMKHEEREQFFAWTFQALGHLLHLIQDASVPAHSRNDLHGLLEPYERWTAKNKASLPYLGDGSDPWGLWKDYTDIPAQNTFIDTYPDPVIQADDFNQGLAQYSYANFLSEDSIYIGDQLGHSDLHDLDGIDFSFIGDMILKEQRQVHDVMRSFLYVKNNTTGIDHFALCRLSWSIKQMMEWQGHDSPVTSILYTVKDDLVSQDYASKLIPRAVGYSAGFLEYFFRGSIEISSPEGFVYAIIDGHETPHEFTSITANLRNITPNEEDMGAGKLIAVAKYKERDEDDYQPDLSTDPPSQPEPSVKFSYSVSEPEPIESLDHEERRGIKP